MFYTLFENTESYMFQKLKCPECCRVSPKMSASFKDDQICGEVFPSHNYSCLCICAPTV
jgi:hypothetical protein